MQNRFHEAVSLEKLKMHLQEASELFSTFSEDEARDLLSITENSIAPSSTDLSYIKYFQILQKGISQEATEEEKQLADMYYAALALPLFPEEEMNKIIEALFDREQQELVLKYEHTPDKKILGPEKALYLARLLPLTTITQLDISSQGIEDVGAIALAALTQLRELKAGGNKIGMEGVKALAANTTLISLRLSYNSIDGAKAKLLAANTTLKILHLGDNEIGLEGVKALAANTTLEDLNLSRNKIDAEMATILADNPVLKKLNLKFNLLKDEGATALAGNKTLVELNVSINQIGDIGAIAFARNETLMHLKLARNLITDEGVIALAANVTLNTLDLQKNHFTAKGAKALAANETLFRIDVSDDLEEESQKALAERNPVKQFNAAKEVGVDAVFPSLKRQVAFFIENNPEVITKNFDKKPKV